MHLLHLHFILSISVVILPHALHEAVQASAAILKYRLLVPAKELAAHWLKHPGLHQGLAQTGCRKAGHLAAPGANCGVLHQVAQHSVHRITAYKAVGVDVQVPPAVAHLDLGAQGMDDVVPQLRGTKRTRDTC